MMAKASTILPQPMRDRLEAMIDAKGILMTARLLGISYNTLKCARLGGTVMAGTLALLHQKFSERDQLGRNP
jgi:hypothetical protein